MTHLPNLITDMALILGAAAFFTLLFKWLKQPLVLGYLIAGFLVGPYFSLLPTVREEENIRIWAEIGVIFLLFSLGLEFSFKKLLKVGGTASITAVVKVLVMVIFGYGGGLLLGWSHIDSLFLGGILSISSTTITIRAFEELGVKSRQFASLVFGVLIVEDLVAIVLMVVLSTLSVSRQFAGMDMLLSILKLVFFLAVWFVSGIFFLPTFLRKIKHLVSDEMLLIISIALCLLMVVFASAVGFSPALGAFIMGSLLAETTKAERIEHLVRPVRDLFGAIFFVPVGMLINPDVLLLYAGPILILCAVTIVGKILSSAAGALLAGQSLQTSVQAGFSLAQIGEFSFIIATLGLTLKVTSEFLYPIAVAVSAVTTLATPYLIRSSGAFYQFLSRHIPPGIQRRLNRYSTETRQAAAASEWRTYLRSTIINGVLLFILTSFFIHIAAQYVLPWIDARGGSLWLKGATALLTLLALLPFLWALAIRGHSDASTKALSDPRFRRPLLVIRFIQLGVGAFLIGYLVNRFFDPVTGIAMTFLMLGLMAAFSKRIRIFYEKLESRFFSNLNQREMAEAANNRTELAPWNAHITSLVVGPDAYCLGKRLADLKWREQIGINVVLIKRFGKQIPAPDRDQQIFPGDELLVLGTDAQIRKLQAVLRPKEEPEVKIIDGEIGLHRQAVQKGSIFEGRTIRQTGLREEAGALVVGLEREGERLLNPESDFLLAEGDVLYIVGNRRKLARVLERS